MLHLLCALLLAPASAEPTAVEAASPAAVIHEHARSLDDERHPTFVSPVFDDLLPTSGSGVDDGERGGAEKESEGVPQASLLLIVGSVLLVLAASSRRLRRLVPAARG